MSYSTPPLKKASGPAFSRKLNWLLVLTLLAGAVFATATQSTAFAAPVPVTIDFSLTGPETALPGQTITYQAHVTFTGAGPAYTLTYNVPYDTDFVSAAQTSGSGNLTCSENNGTVTCESTTALTLGQETLVNFTVKVWDYATPGFYIYSQAYLAGGGFNRDSNEVLTHVPSNTNISIQGPATVLPGGIVTYKLLIKNSGTLPVSNIQLQNVFPEALAFISGDPGDCTVEPASIKDVKTSGMVNANTVYCSFDTLAAGATQVVTLNFSSMGELGQCFINDATIYVYGGQVDAVRNGAKTSSMGGDTSSASITTCFAETPPPPVVQKPAAAQLPADLAAQLRVSSNLDVLSDPSADISYTLTVINNGFGKAHSIQVTFPFDSNLTVGYATFDTAGAWVSAVNAGSIVIQLPDLDHNQSVNATVVLHPAASLPAGTAEFNRFSVNYDDSMNSGKVENSNGVRYNLSSATENQNNGNVQMFNPAAVTLTNGQQQTFTADFFAPGELVSAWYTDKDGKSVSLGTVTAGPNGEISIGLTPTSLTAGQQYILAAYGSKSGVYGSSVITIGA